MTGLLGWGSAYDTMHGSDLLLLGTDFPYEAFMPTNCQIAQVDVRAERLGRRAKLDLGLCGDIKATSTAQLPLLEKKTDAAHLEGAQRAYNHAVQKLQAYVTHGEAQTPIRPEFVVVVDQNALSLPPHISLGMAEGFALSMAKQVLQGRGEHVVETITHNLRLRP